MPGYDSSSDALLLKAVHDLGKGQFIKFTVDHYAQELEQIIATGSNETFDEDTSTAFSVDYRHNGEGAFWDSLELQGYVSQYEQTSDQVLFSTRGYTDFNDYRFKQDIVGFRAVFSNKLETAGATHQLVYGVDYDNYDTTRPRLKTRVLTDGTVSFADEPQAAFPGADTTLSGLFVQDNIEFANSGLSLIAGGRIDFYDMEPKQNSLYDDENIVAIDETAFSPKLGLVYDANENTSVYVQYVEGFKIPPHDQAYQSHGVEPFYQIIPNADLESEESQSIELGARVKLKDSSLEINLYKSEFDNFIESTLVGTEATFIPGVLKQIYQYQNLDKTEIQGVELSYSMALGESAELDFNVAWADGENSETGQPLTSISPISGSTMIRTHWQDWTFISALRFAKSMNDVPTDGSGADLMTSAGYGVADVFAQYEYNNWRLTAGVENLFDKEYVPYESIAGMEAGASTDQFTQPGRELSVKVNYTF